MSVYEKISHRTGSTKLNLKNGDGTPVIKKAISVKQRKHEFLFGCSEFSSIAYASGELEGSDKIIAEERYERLADIFNYVTLPFYLRRFEPEKGKPDTARLRKAAEMFKSKNITLKGHPLCWHTLAPQWLTDLDNDALMKMLLDRIKRDVSEFKGLVDMWDVVNEAVIMPVFDKDNNGVTRLCKEIGRFKLLRQLFAVTNETNPEATLLINDFNTSQAYEILIEGLLDAGVKIDVIGIQSHMHQGYWGVEKTLKVLNRFERFGLPIHFTESTLVSGEIMPPHIVDLNDYSNKEWCSTPDGEERQAREAVLHYKTLFEHPLVKSITWWSFNDGLWLGAPSGLITRDSKPKPAYNELYKLIKGEWWSGEQTLVTDHDGNIEVSGFKGEYTAEYNDTVIDFVI